MRLETKAQWECIGRRNDGAGHGGEAKHGRSECPLHHDRRCLVFLPEANSSTGMSDNREVSGVPPSPSHPDSDDQTSLCLLPCPSRARYRWMSSSSTMKNVMMAPTPRHLTTEHMVNHELIACLLGCTRSQLRQISATNGATFIRHHLSRPPCARRCVDTTPRIAGLIECKVMISLQGVFLAATSSPQTGSISSVAANTRRHASQDVATQA